jgi:hypothetical protein
MTQPSPIGWFYYTITGPRLQANLIGRNRGFFPPLLLKMKKYRGLMKKGRNKMTKIRFSFVFVAFRLFFCYTLRRHQRGGPRREKGRARSPQDRFLSFDRAKDVMI